MKNLLFIFAITCISACSVAAQNGIDTTKLKLEQLTVVSRHNVRAPLQKNVDSTYNNVESKDMLMEFTVPGSHLTERGCILETIMGVYFRGWMASEGLLKQTEVKVKDNKGGKDTTLAFEIGGIIPDISDYYFAASPRQRTVASTRAFAVGLLPGNSVEIHHQKIDSKDPDYLPYFVDYGIGVKKNSFDIKLFKKKAYLEVESVIDQNKKELEKSYNVLMKAVNYSESRNAKKWRPTLSTDSIKGEIDLEFYKKDGNIKEPEAKDTSHLRAANQLSDALILQYLEMDKPANTGLHIDNNDIKAWRAIADIKDIYSKILFTAPMVAVNTSHRLLCQVKAGITNNKFNFICTHDTSISALLTALQVNDYSLPDSLTIEGLTPNGCKLCIEKYRQGDDYYGRVRLLYQSTKQVRNLTMLDYNAKKDEHYEMHPKVKNLYFKGLNCVNCNCDNDKGCTDCDKCKDSGCFYKWEDLMKRIDNTIAAFAKVAKGEKPF